MAHVHKSDAEYVAGTHNTARFFTEHRQIGLVLLLAAFVWGWYGYHHMPKRKDPDIPVRVALAQCPWPGATAEQVEQLVTRPMEQAIALNSTIKAPSPSDFGIRSISFPGQAVVYVQLSDDVNDKMTQFSDINLKLQQLNSQLPRVAGPIQFNSNFGDTAALMLTVASPIATITEIALRARAVRAKIEEVRASEGRDAPQPRLSVIYSFPMSVSPALVRESFQRLVTYAAQTGALRDVQFFEAPGFVGADVYSTLDAQALRAFGNKLMEERLHHDELPPDAWQPTVIRDPSDAEAKLAEIAGAKYSYRQLDDFTDLIQRTLQGVPEVSQVTRSGVLQEQIYLNYSQQRLAQYGYDPSKLKDVLNAQNITLPAGTLEAGSKNIDINPSGLFPDAQAIGNVIIGVSSLNSPVYLRDLVDISRSYQSPPTFLNFMHSAAGLLHPAAGQA